MYKFSKKHYEYLASVLADRCWHLYNKYPEPPARSTAHDHEIAGRKAELQFLIQRFANCFKIDNPAFNRDRFYRDALGMIPLAVDPGASPVSSRLTALPPREASWKGGAVR